MAISSQTSARNNLDAKLLAKKFVLCGAAATVAETGEAGGSESGSESAMVN